MSADMLSIPLPADLSADERRKVADDARVFADLLVDATRATSSDYERAVRVTGEAVLTYADDLRDLAESLPIGVGRDRLETVLYCAGLVEAVQQ